MTSGIQKSTYSTFRQFRPVLTHFAFSSSRRTLSTDGQLSSHPTSQPSTLPPACTEVEPKLTLCRRSAVFTRLVYSPSKGLLYSASIFSIRISALPAPSSRTCRSTLRRRGAS